MNFLDRQEQNHKANRLLLILFGFAIICIIIFAYLLISVPIYFCDISLGEVYRSYSDVWSSRVFLLFVVIVTTIILTNSVCHIMDLRKGGSAIAEMLNAQLIPRDTDNLAEIQILNIVEEMAIASGLPIPQVYLLYSDSINAFTAGCTEYDAIIGVTSACIEKLSREELQAIIAHEFSHIRNGDIRLKTQTMGVIFGLISASMFGKQVCLRHVENPRFNLFALGLILIGGIFFIFGLIGLACGRIIQACISRRTEFLADAYAVQFTRNPEALSNALRKIGNSHDQIESSHIIETSHLFFTSPDNYILSSHPPIEKRIRMINPLWDGSFLDSFIQEKLLSHKEERSKRIFDIKKHQEQVLLKIQTDFLNQKNTSLIKDNAAIIFFLEIHPILASAIHNPDLAKAVLGSLLLGNNEAQHQQTLNMLRHEDNETFIQNVNFICPYVLKNAKKHRLAIIEICTASLKGHFTAVSYPTFEKLLRKIAFYNQKISREEFILLSLINGKLDPRQNNESVFSRYEKFSSMSNATSIFLSYIAVLANVSQQDCKALFSKWTFQAEFPILSYRQTKPDDWQSVEKTLNHLKKLAPHNLKSLISCLHELFIHDDNINSEEEETFRTVCFLLKCPMPPNCTIST